MKRNVDLTEHGDFRARSLSERRVRLTVEDMLFFDPSNIDFKQEVFRTGNREERMYKKTIDESISENYCDRCGADLSRYPFLRIMSGCGSLCPDCIRALDLEMGVSECLAFHIDRDMHMPSELSPFRF